MAIRLKEDRRFVPRFRVWATCSLVLRLSDEDRRQNAVLGYVKDLNREAVAVLLPSHETYGVDASTLGQVELTLGLPIGYLKLSATVLRHSVDKSGEQHLVVFRIEKSKDRSKYYDFVDALEADPPTH